MYYANQYMTDYKGNEDYGARKEELYYWLKAHWCSLCEDTRYVAARQSDYESSLAANSATTETTDPLLTQAVRSLNAVPGIRVRSSCQGKCCSFEFLGRRLVSDGGHDLFAKIEFDPLIEDLRILVEKFGRNRRYVTYNRQWPFQMRATDVDDNTVFCQKIADLQDYILTRMPPNMSHAANRVRS